MRKRDISIRFSLNRQTPDRLFYTATVFTEEGQADFPFFCAPGTSDDTRRELFLKAIAEESWRAQDPYDTWLEEYGFEDTPEYRKQYDASVEIAEKVAGLFGSVDEFCDMVDHDRDEGPGWSIISAKNDADLVLQVFFDGKCTGDAVLRENFVYNGAIRDLALEIMDAVKKGDVAKFKSCAAYIAKDNAQFQHEQNIENRWMATVEDEKSEEMCLMDEMREMREERSKKPRGPRP